MRLITAHKILIATAIVFFFGFGLWEFKNYSQSGETSVFIRAVIYLLVSFGFGIYLKTIKKWLK